MKLGIFLGLSIAAVGGAAYAHKRRGGTFTLDSIKDSLNAAKGSVQEKLAAAKDSVQGLVDKAAPNQGAETGSSTKERYGYSEYSVAKGDRDLH